MPGRYWFAALLIGCAGSGPRKPTCNEVACTLVGRAPNEHAFYATMSTLASAVDDCSSEYTGFFPVEVTLDPAGVVADVAQPRAFEGTLDAELLACVARVVRAKRFDPGLGRGTLTYAFELR
jgi:hypothetical protein